MYGLQGLQAYIRKVRDIVGRLSHPVSTMHSTSVVSEPSVQIMAIYFILNLLVIAFSVCLDVAGLSISGFYSISTRK